LWGCLTPHRYSKTFGNAIHNTKSYLISVFGFQRTAEVNGCCLVITSGLSITLRQQSNSRYIDSILYFPHNHSIFILQLLSTFSNFLQLYSILFIQIHDFQCIMYKEKQCTQTMKTTKS
jgi:hypothetical protein